MHSGKQCFNVLADQEPVTRLLNAIPRSQGGADGSLPAPTTWGIASMSLHKAILDFQRWHHLSVDGHVDPKGTAITLMDRLAGGSSAGGLGTSEVGPASSTGSGRVCGPMRPVLSGFLPGTIDLDGGPTGQIVFKDLAFPVTVEINVTSPGFASGLRTVTATRASPTALLLDVGMPPPVRWTIRVQAAKTIVAAVKWEFSTDWVSGEPPCIPSR
jgi:hypothetical protein